MGPVDRPSNLEHPRVVQPNVERLVPEIRALFQLCGEFESVKPAFLDQGPQPLLVGQFFGVLKDSLDREPLGFGQIQSPVIDDIDLVFRQLIPGDAGQGLVLVETCLQHRVAGLA